MKTLLFALGLAVFAAPASAVQVQMSCSPKIYQCYGSPQGPVDCQWSMEPAQTNVLNLVQDPNYPNAQYPYQVWRGQYQNVLDGHNLIVNVTYSTDPNAALSMSASLITPTVAADTSGANTIDIDLHNQSFGRGFFCQAQPLLP